MSGLLKSKFAAALLSATEIIGTAQAGQVELRADANDTIIFRVKDYAIRDRHASIKVDASAIDDNKMAIITDRITKAAILMPGMDNNRLCPYFELAKHRHTITQIESDKYDFQVETEVTPDESKAAQDKQCLIIKIPSRSEIIWKN